MMILMEGAPPRRNTPALSTQVELRGVNGGSGRPPDLPKQIWVDMTQEIQAQNSGRLWLRWAIGRHWSSLPKRSKEFKKETQKDYPLAD